MSGTRLALEFLLFPGLLFTAVAGLLTSWVDRKVTARVQMRVGPPLLQPFYDLRKYFVKETCVPEGGSVGLFLAAPLIGFAGVVLASMILWRALLDPAATFVGDLIVLVYLLMMPALGVVLGAFSSRNPLASIGGSREMQLMMAYELPLGLAKKRYGGHFATVVNDLHETDDLRVHLLRNLSFVRTRGPRCV